MDRLEQLKAEFVTHHEATKRLTQEAGDRLAEAVEHARQCGLLLQEIKAECGHGEFMAWVRENLHVSQTTVDRYKRIAERWEEIPDEEKRKGVGAVDKFLIRGERVGRFNKADMVEHAASPLANLLDGLPDAEDPSFTRELYRRHWKAKKLARERQPSTNPVPFHFLDSGAYGLQKWATKYAERHPGKDPLHFYRTKAFMHYLEDYASFIKRYASAIDLYVNVDVPGNAELSHRHQRMLEEEHGLRPVPVIHYPAHMKWLTEYYADRYEVIGLGVRADSPKKIEWLDRCFGLLQQDNELLAKIHGFAMTSHTLMFKYPWHSVDSSTWLVVARNGLIIVPQKGTNDQFVFDKKPHVIAVSEKNPETTKVTPELKNLAREWLESIDVPFDPTENDPGVTSGEKDYTARAKANLLYYEQLQKSVPNCPTIFYSGCCQGCNPEDVLGNDVNIMLSYIDMDRKAPIEPRFRSLLRTKAAHTEKEEEQNTPAPEEQDYPRIYPGNDAVGM